MKMHCSNSKFHLYLPYFWAISIFLISRIVIALGLVFWLYERPVDYTRDWIEKKFKNSEQMAKANTLALQAGYNYADTTEVFTTHFRVRKASLEPGTYRKITGNEATVRDRRHKS